MSNQNEIERQENGHNGIWIGIDLGTSNSACAVWDSSRGGSKWIRLKGVTESQDTKAGRIMPSVVRFQNNEEEPLVGFPALQSSTENAAHSSSLIRSVKRLLGKRFEDLDAAWVETLDFEVQNSSEDSEDDSLQLVMRTENGDQLVTRTPQQVLAIELKAIRESCQAYLDRYRVSKNLVVPGGTDNGVVDNVVVGVPAHYSQRHIGLVKEACREAGFQGYVGTCLESTAAAIAYGLTLQENSKRSPGRKKAPVTIMVVDMGGGTTDITIASNRNTDTSSSSDNDDPYRVLVTQGDDRLGGDDIDQAIIEYCLQKASQQSANQEEVKTDSLKLECRKAKEALCRLDDPSSSETIVVSSATSDAQSSEIVITQEILNETILKPWLQKARDLIIKAQNNMNEHEGAQGLSIDEVILVGGTTRVPAIRRMIQDIFPEIELSSSLNPMSSVAQGLAVQAAIVSKQIPMYELKSAMMLDCVPHAIGVQLPSADGQDGGGFVEIIPRNTLLPAMGSATFLLADKHQAGVTIKAVEEVGTNKYEPMSKEDFSFVLRKLSKSQSDTMSSRTIQVGMKLDTDGKFIVSIFDENDPEQVRKRDRFERIQKGQVVGELDYIKDMMLAESDDITLEQVMLTITLISVFVLYIAIKIAFTDPLEDGSTILG